MNMKMIKCSKCGSNKMILKRNLDDGCGHNTLDSIIFWVVGFCTLGLYFIFKFTAEKRRAELGLDYYECEVCHYRIRASKVDTVEEKKEKREDFDEEDLKAIKEIGKKPVDMATWKDERQKAVIKRREEKEKAEEEQKEDKN